MNKKKLILPLLAVILVLTATIQPALAYFTTYTRAKGGYTIHQGSTTTIDEEFDDWTKHLVITNKEGKPVFVRARAFAGEAFTLEYSGGGWSDGGDGWWYYNAPLAAGESTAGALDIRINNVPQATAEAGFNVAVVYESTPVLYKPDGSAYADWSMILDRGGEQG